MMTMMMMINLQYFNLHSHVLQPYWAYVKLMSSFADSWFYHWNTLLMRYECDSHCVLMNNFYNKKRDISFLFRPLNMLHQQWHRTIWQPWAMSWSDRSKQYSNYFYNCWKAYTKNHLKPTNIVYRIWNTPCAMHCIFWTRPLQTLFSKGMFFQRYQFKNSTRFKLQFLFRLLQ